MARTWHCLCWLLLLLGWAGPAAAWVAGEPRPVRLHAGMAAVPLEDHALGWMDPTGQRGADAVERDAPQLHWSPRRGAPQDRLGPDRALWIRFAAVAEAPGPWFLHLGVSDIEDARLYYRDSAGRWVLQEAGGELAPAQWPLRGRVPTFILADEPGRKVDYWLRVEHSRTTLSAPMELHSLASLTAAREGEQFFLGSYFGVACLVALAALVSGLRYGDRAFLAYFVYVVLLGSGQLARLGIDAQYLYPGSATLSQLTRMVVQGLSPAAALWFVKVVTEPGRFSRGLDAAVWVVVAAVVASTVLDATVGSRTSFNILLACTALALLAIAGLIAWAWIDGRDPDIPLIALGFLPVLLLALFPLARGMNLIPISGFTRYAIFVGALLEMPILYYALTERAHRRRESEVRAAALTHSDALTGLALRRTLLQRLEAALARVRSQHQHGALLAVRIANIDTLREDWGRDTVEKAVVVTASHLMRALTSIDLAARVGEYEFALLLEAPVTPEQALSRAQQVVAGGLRQADALPPGATLRFHVAVALLPQQELDAAATLLWALDGLAQMPPDTRKAIRPLNF